MFTYILFAMVASAMSQDQPFVSKAALNEMTVGQAAGICAGDQTVNCCVSDINNHQWGASESETGTAKDCPTCGPEKHHDGDQALGLFSQCSPINVFKGNGAAALRSECKGKVACCNKAESIHVKNGGFINNGAPQCVVYGNIV